MALVIVDQALYIGGERRPCGDLSDELAALRASGAPEDFLWIGLKNPTQAEFDEVNAELQLHPLAVEDAIQGRQRAKVEIYDNSVFVVLKPVRYVEETSDIETGELMCFIGDRFIVTVRRGEAAPLSGLRHRLESEPALMRRGPMAVLHAIVDGVVDNYMLIDAELSNDLDDIETGVFSGADMDSSTIYRLKREVLEFRRAAAPLAPPLMALHESDNPHVTDRELRLQFRDVSDHLQAVIDHVESYDRLLTDVLGAHLTQITVQQNNDMRRISAWVAIAAVPTMIAGIYGMNFDNMPELRASIAVGSGQFKYGYFVVMAVMLVTCGSLYRAFKRSGWL
jgi:magnesium transporter